jgi:hypothetical protein
VHLRPRVRRGEQRFRARAGVHAQDAANLDGLLRLPRLAEEGHQNQTSSGSSAQSSAHHTARSDLADLHRFCQGNFSHKNNFVFHCAHLKHLLMPIISSLIKLNTIKLFFV